MPNEENVDEFFYKYKGEIENKDDLYDQIKR
jgi:hypothetical protein